MTETQTLPRSTPAAEGVSSSAVLAFVDALEAGKYNLHSLMLLRHGKVIAEGWWQPYSPDCKRYVYSLSKSFTSSAIGFAVAEGLLTVDDPVISFFPEDLPPVVSDNLAAMSVKNLLTMSSGHTEDTTTALFTPGLENWAQAILALPVGHTPGAPFVYNSGASYLLSAIITQLSGQSVLEYLTPRLFQPLGITDISWESCPRGINSGGWGLSIRTEDIAKFGLLYAQKGLWNGKQILPAAWVEEASAAQVRNDGAGRENEPTEWRQGYGYQFWRCQHNAYRGDGAFGQYCVVMPDQDAVLVMTSETADMGGALRLAWEILLPAMQTTALPEEPAAQAQLQTRLAGLHMPLTPAAAHPAIVAEVCGKTFRMDANRSGIETVSFRFEKKGCTFSLRDGAGEHLIRCGNGAWVENESSLPMMKFHMLQMAAQQPLTQAVRIAAAGSWLDGQCYELRWQFLESPHSESLLCCFAGETLTLTHHSSLLGADHPMAGMFETKFSGTMA